MKKTTGGKPIGTRVAVSEKILQKSAARVLAHASVLVSTEVQYLQGILGATATQGEIDENVVAVRKMPWMSFAPRD